MSIFDRMERYTVYPKAKTYNMETFSWQYDPELDGSEIEYAFGYSSMQRDARGPIIEVPYTGYSDYGGSVVERANCDYLKATYNDLPGLYEAYGGHGSRGYFVHESVLEKARQYDDNPDDNPDLFQFSSFVEECEGLDGYPLFQDDYMSHLEMETEWEDWDCWLKSDFISAIVKEFAPDFTHDESDFLENWLRECDDQDLFELYRQACDGSNTYYEMETAVGGYVDLKRLIKWLRANVATLQTFLEKNNVRELLTAAMEDEG
jgi:hypothetical protein